ncbi:GyrI-like domain-containing protein [Winogradskyella sp.]|uniref:GyrI-like domain-containing protein n=1 Tax=Winogradskyella sp. TaxID=1883156 RepID=UPI003BA9A715
MKSQMRRHEYGHIVALWKRFMPRRRDITNVVNEELVAIQNYENPNDAEQPFTIWACVEVSDVETVPEQMHSLTIPGGLYAVFRHKGMDAGATYRDIMNEWLPSSGYAIANRPHFQVMGALYKNGSPDSEEDFYVPIRTL